VWLSRKYLYVKFECPRCREDYWAEYRYRDSWRSDCCPLLAERSKLVRGEVVKARLRRKPSYFELKCPECGAEWRLEVELYDYEWL